MSVGGGGNVAEAGEIFVRCERLQRAMLNARHPDIVKTQALMQMQKSIALPAADSKVDCTATARPKLTEAGSETALWTFAPSVLGSPESVGLVGGGALKAVQEGTPAKVPPGLPADRLAPT